jgi:hypothetical protein
VCSPTRRSTTGPPRDRSGTRRPPPEHTWRTRHIDTDEDEGYLYEWTEEQDSGPHLPISKDLVLDLIELLQEHAVRFERRGSSAADAYAAARLMGGTSYALARLLALLAKSERKGGTLSPDP